MTALSEHIQATPMVDTHEHQMLETDWVNKKPDILLEIFENYLLSDLIVSGLDPTGQKNVNDSENEDIVGRFKSFERAWQLCQHTGYGESARLAGKIFYGLDEFTPESLAKAASLSTQYHQPGQRYRIMHEIANLDHCHVDHMVFQLPTDPTAPEFFLHDVTWSCFVNGELRAQQIGEEFNIEVKDLSSFRLAQEKLFEKYAPFAIAVKSQHAYQRTIRWQPRSDQEAEQALNTLLKITPGETHEAAQLCLGDWCLGHAAQLAPKYGLPIKIHTGYLATVGNMLTEEVRGGHLCTLFSAYPNTKFDLFHISWPFEDELVAIVKHYPNVYVDMCWAWQMDPLASMKFVRHIIHAAPTNKLFVFGGDCGYPINAAAYAALCRKYLTRALQAEIEAGDLTESQAIKLATQFMRDNQYEVFDIAGRQQALVS